MDWGINHELWCIDWFGLLCGVAYAHIHLFCTGNVGVLGRRGNFLSNWDLARFLSLGPLMMDEDTKLVLEAWRGLLWENDMLHRRINALEKELGYTYVAKRLDVGWDSVPWRRVGLGRRGDADSSD